MNELIDCEIIFRGKGFNAFPYLQCQFTPEQAGQLTILLNKFLKEC